MIWQTGIHKVFVFWHTPYCIPDFTYLFMYLVYNNNFCVILDANCFLFLFPVYTMPTSEARVSDSATATSVLPLKRFKFRAAKIESATTGSQANCDCITPQTQLNKFLIEMNEPGQHPDALHYWHERRVTYDCLADTALEARPTWCVIFSGVHRTCVFLFVAYWLKDATTEWQNRLRCGPDWN